MTRSVALATTGLVLAASAACSTAQHLPSAGEPAPFVERRSVDRIPPHAVDRIGDLVATLGASGGWSIDDFRRATDPGGVYAPGTERLPVRLDGVPIRTDGLLGDRLELLPLLPSWLRVADVGLAPGGGAGGVVRGGRLDLATTDAEPGLTVVGRIGLANETGDPGPYRYTPLDSPNVDRVGPNHEISGAVRSGPLEIRAGVRGDIAHLTDERIYDRVRLLYDGARRPYLQLRARAASAVLDAGGGRHTLLAGSTTLRDLRYTAPLGREVPLTERFTVVGGAGDGRLAGAWRWHYAWATQRSRIAPRYTQQTISYGLTERHTEAEGGVGLQGAGHSVRFTIGARTDRLASAPPIANPSVTTRHIRMDGSWTGARFWKQWLTVEVQISDLDPSNPGRAALSAVWSHRLGTGRFQADVSVARVTEITERPADEAYWASWGWSHPAWAAGVVTAPLRPPDAAVWTADAALTLRPSPGIRLTAGVLGRLFRSMTLPDMLTIPDTSAWPGFRTSVEYRSGVAGSRYGVRIAVDVDPGTWYRHRLRLRAERTAPGADVLFWQLWSARPGIEARYELSLLPSSRSAVQLVGRYRSVARWPTVLSLQAPDAPGRAERLRPTLHLDLVVWKALWGSRLRIHAALTNLNGIPERTHPLAPETDLALRVGATARFGLRPQG